MKYQYERRGPIFPVNVDYGCTGHFTHSGSGLVLTLYRFYDPAVGKWVSRDPIWEVGGINLYAYVINKPLSDKDILGLKCCGGCAGQLVGISSIMGTAYCDYSVKCNEFGRGCKGRFSSAITGISVPMGPKGCEKYYITYDVY